VRDEEVSRVFVVNMGQGWSWRLDVVNIRSRDACGCIKLAEMVRSQQRVCHGLWGGVVSREGGFVWDSEG
jgi:hypothetical protein